MPVSFYYNFFLAFFFIGCFYICSCFYEAVFTESPACEWCKWFMTYFLVCLREWIGNKSVWLCRGKCGVFLWVGCMHFVDLLRCSVEFIFHNVRHTNSTIGCFLTYLVVLEQLLNSLVSPNWNGTHLLLVACWFNSGHLEPFWFMPGLVSFIGLSEMSVMCQRNFFWNNNKGASIYGTWKYLQCL